MFNMYNKYAGKPVKNGNTENEKNGFSYLYADMNECDMNDMRVFKLYSHIIHKNVDLYVRNEWTGERL